METLTHKQVIEICAAYGSTGLDDARIAVARAAGIDPSNAKWLRDERDCTLRYGVYPYRVLELTMSATYQLAGQIERRSYAVPYTSDGSVDLSRKPSTADVCVY